MATQKSDPSGGTNEFWNAVVPPRELNNWEQAMVAYLMKQPFRGRDEVRRQRESARVTHVNAEDPSVLINVDHRPENRVAGAR